MSGLHGVLSFSSFFDFSQSAALFTPWSGPAVEIRNVDAAPRKLSNCSIVIAFLRTGTATDRPTAMKKR